MNDRGCAAVACLMLFWAAAVPAQQVGDPAGKPPAQEQPLIAPDQRPVAAPQPSPPRLDTGVPAPQRSPAVATTTVPVTILNLPMARPEPAALGSELRSRIREQEQHFREKGAEAAREFNLRQAEERKEFAAATAEKGFWERRRLTREFHATQAKQRLAFNKEQEKRRRANEWRFP